MKSLLTTSIAICSLSLIACNSVPECNSDEAKELVIQISNKEMIRQLGKVEANKVDLEVQSVRTKDVNETTGAYSCASELKFVSTDGTDRALPITYTVEATDDGENFYVNVFGL